jgi:diguanylate cyclase (GGDEF)-like protein
VLAVGEERAQAPPPADFLKEAGLVLRHLADPRDIRQVLVEYKPEVMLVDDSLSSCTGPELAEVIRQQDPALGLPFVFTVGAPWDGPRLQAAIRRGDAVLVRPFGGDLLASSLLSRALGFRAKCKHLQRDGLTGLSSHRRFREDLEAELARARRSLKPMALALLDIDYFRQINELCGLPAGDAVLRSLARIIQRRVRVTDHAGRYGGDAFGLVFPGTDLEQAQGILEEIRSAFGEITHQAGDREFRASLSAGVAMAEGHQDPGELVAAAEVALLAAKKAGRDQVVTAPDRPGS